MRFLEIDQLEDMAAGAAILGSGGGGATHDELAMARCALEQWGPVRLLSIDELDPELPLFPMAFMGAPTVASEKIPSGREFELLYEAVSREMGREPQAAVALEIGGGNAFAPLPGAARRGIPLLDADSIGRAFPELQMSSCHLAGVVPSPTFLVDACDNLALLRTGDTVQMERFCRALTVEMGSSAALSIYPMRGAQAREALVGGTVSLAIALGSCVRQARHKGENPAQALVAFAGGRHFGSGMITSIDQRIEKGFLRGSLTVQGDREEESFSVDYQNEYLLLSRAGQPLAATPDLLVLLEEETGEAITSDSLQYGMRVALLALPAHGLWRTPRGLSLVGPQAFGYAIDYASVACIEEQPSFIAQR